MRLFCTTVLFTICVSTAHAGVIFEENFDYANEAELDAAWSFVQTGGGNPLKLGTDAAVTSDEPYGIVGNVIISRDLGSTVTGDWVLSLDMIHTNYRRDSWVMLVNADGDEGYGLRWRSLSETANDGQGAVSIVKLTDAPAVWDDSSVLTTLSSETASGNVAIENPFAEMQLSWQASTGTLTLTVDGVQKGTAIDGDFSSFSQMYIRGNGDQLHDNILLIPEPGSMGLMAIGAAMVLARSSRARPPLP